MTTAHKLHGVRFPGESDEYRHARDELLHAEIELRDRIEAVAGQRRRLPPGGELPADYTFHEWDTQTGTPRPVRLSELFDDGRDTLFLYSFMYIPDPEGNPLGSPCPSCTAIIDAVAGQARHLTQLINFAAAAKVPIEQFRAHAYTRSWPGIRLLSSASTSYNRDYHAEGPDGGQQPMATVFTRSSGPIRHVWSSELFFTPTDRGYRRHVDFMWPLWNILDCTPAGRGTNWHPQLDYLPAQAHC